MHSVFKSVEDYNKVMESYDSLLSRCPYSYQSLYVDTELGKTHIIISGNPNKSPLILLHGWGGSSADFYLEFPFLMHDYQIYAIDINGHSGRSMLKKPKPNENNYVEWLAGLLNELKITNADFVGLSGGGRLILKFASRYPQEIRKGVVISPMGITQFTLRFIVISLLEILFPSRLTARLYAEFVTSPYGSKGEIYEEFCKGIFLTLKHYRGLVPPILLLSEKDLGKISAPILLLAGEQEHIFDPAKMITRAKKYIKNIKCILVNSAGHTMTIDQNHLVGQYILEFLQQM